MVNVIIKKIIESWNQKLLGELINIQVSELKETNANCFIEDNFIDLYKSNIAAAISTRHYLGTATTETLQSVKKRIDISAGFVFNDAINDTNLSQAISVSEGKDEDGNVVYDPLKSEEINKNKEIGIAVDVVDGTTLAAKGIDGAYTLSALASNLKAFPDMQAYALGGPRDIVEKFNFFNNPELEVDNLIEMLCIHYNKQPSQLKVLTHSYDTGKHHQELIDAFIKRDVTVIIPDPVIVEPPYTIAMALRFCDSPDCVLGVFGLPEIVINTLLLATVNDGYGLKFRIASNSMLSNKFSTNLDDAFNFSSNEIDTLMSMNLDINFLYDIENIVSSTSNICSVSTALTKDPILDMVGCYEKEGYFVTESILAFCRNTYRVKTTHKCYNHINYSACYAQKINDISSVAFISNNIISKAYSQLLGDFEQLAIDNFFIFTPLDDLHITTFEFGVHYGGYDFFNFYNVIKLTKDSLQVNDFLCEVTGVKILMDAIVFEVLLPDDIKNKKVFLEDEDKIFFNIMKAPKAYHITIARFNCYITKEVKEKIKTIVNKINSNTEFPVIINSSQELLHIFNTPFIYEKY